MAQALLVESGADKTDVALIDSKLSYKEGYPLRDQFKTPQLKADFLEGLRTTSNELFSRSQNLEKKAEVIELSSAGIIDKTNGHIKTTNSGELAYSMQEVCDALKTKGIETQSWECHNDMPPGIKGAISHITNQEKEIDYSKSDKVEVIKDALESRVTDNIAYCMPGGGYGVGLAIKDNGKYIIVPGELGHILIGESGDKFDRTVVDYILKNGGKKPEYEHVIGGKFLKNILDTIIDSRETLRLSQYGLMSTKSRAEIESKPLLSYLQEDWKNQLSELKAKVNSNPDSARIISESADGGNSIAQLVMKKAASYYIRSTFEAINAANCGIVVMTGHFINKSQYVKDSFNDLLEEEAANRVHEGVYKDRVDYVKIDDPNINLRGLEAFARERISINLSLR